MPLFTPLVEKFLLFMDDEILLPCSHKPVEFNPHAHTLFSKDHCTIKHCATSGKVMGSIPDIIGFFN
jgi:hypothetical protein